jgi:hypothetical protein
MPVIFNHFWIMFIVVTIANGLIWKVKSKKYIAENPVLKEGYDSLIKGWLIYVNIPWTIMGIGMLTGLTKSMDDFFNPRLGNPIVIVFFLVIIVEWILGSRWIFFQDGAEKLVKHPGMFTQTEKGNEKFEIMKIKLMWIVGMIGCVVGFYMMWKMNMPVGTFGQ